MKCLKRMSQKLTINTSWTKWYDTNRLFQFLWALGQDITLALSRWPAWTELSPQLKGCSFSPFMVAGTLMKVLLSVPEGLS